MLFDLTSKLAGSTLADIDSSKTGSSLFISLKI
jgi:hypothetical protein